MPIDLKTCLRGKLPVLLALAQYYKASQQFTAASPPPPHQKDHQHSRGVVWSRSVTSASHGSWEIWRFTLSLLRTQKNRSWFFPPMRPSCIHSLPTWSLSVMGIQGLFFVTCSYRRVSNTKTQRWVSELMFTLCGQWFSSCCNAQHLLSFISLLRLYLFRSFSNLDNT